MQKFSWGETTCMSHTLEYKEGGWMEILHYLVDSRGKILLREFVFKPILGVERPNKFKKLLRMYPDYC